MANKLKGIILAGGKGTRLLPATRVMNKHMIPILNIPMIEYPLHTLINMGIKDVLIITGGNHVGGIAEYLGDGSEFGVNITYKVQKEAGGMAQALLLAEGYAKHFAVILGDNIFETPIFPPKACGLVIKSVKNPSRFGVYHKGSITEKPPNPKSNKVVTGLYFYTEEIFDYIKTLKPSKRGELEITDVNNWCLKNLDTEIIKYSDFWSDAGTIESLKNIIKWI